MKKKIEIENLKVTRIDAGRESIWFGDSVRLYSNHEQDCCENHYLSLEHLTLKDFDGLVFDLSDENFFKRIEGYGIELRPKNGFPVRIPGYGSNNGYYSEQLDLVVEKDGKVFSQYDISECQVVTD